MLHDDRDRVRFFIQRGEELFVADLFHRPFGKLLVIAEHRQGVFEEGRGELERHSLVYSTGSGVGEEAVADAADGKQVLRVGGVILDVAAKADDEVVDGAGVRVLMDMPDLLEDGGPRDYLAFALGQKAEQVGLHDGEVGEAIGGDEFESIEVDGSVVEEVGSEGADVGGGTSDATARLAKRCGAAGT